MQKIKHGEKVKKKLIAKAKENKEVTSAKRLHASLTDDLLSLFGTDRTLRRHLNDDPALSAELNEIYLLNAMKSGSKGTKYLEKFIEDEENPYEKHDYLGQRLILDASTRMMDNGTRAVSKRIELQRIKEENETLKARVKELEGNLNKVTSETGLRGGGQVLPYYILEYGADYQGALEDQQKWLLAYIDGIKS